MRINKFDSITDAVRFQEIIFISLSKYIFFFPDNTAMLNRCIHYIYGQTTKKFCRYSNMQRTGINL